MFLMSILISWVVPVTSYAIENFYYYTAEIMDAPAGPYTEVECNAFRLYKLNQGISNNNSWKITRCVKIIKTPPTKATEAEIIALSPYESLATAATGTTSILDKWWWENFETSTRQYYINKIGGFTTEKDCKDNIATYSFNPNAVGGVTGGKVLTKLCFPSKTQPVATLYTIPIDALKKPLKSDTTYYPLAPLPGIGKMDCPKEKDMYGKDTTNCIDTAPSATNLCPFGNYLNMIIKIVIGICAVLAMIMIVMGGIEYMTSELGSSKEEGKKKITGAIFGLLIALGAFALLNTLNPQLLEICLGNMPKAEVTINVDAPEGGDISEGDHKPAICGPNSTLNGAPAATGFCMFGTIQAPKPTGGDAGIPGMVALLKSDSGYKITSMTIYTANKRIWFGVTKGTDKKQFATNGVGFGGNGIAEVGEGKVGDRKTPKGDWKTTSAKYVSNSQSIRINNHSGQSMGGVAIGLNVGVGLLTTGSRGIMIHGNSGNKTGISAGCILMHNDDLLAIAPYITAGIYVDIK